MRAQSINPDAYTYSILLNYAKRREDRDGIDQILADARHDGTLEKSPFIIADLLHVVYLRERRERNGAVFTTLLSTYQLFFDVQPLKDLGLLSDEYYQPPSPNLSQPPPPPLGMMIVAFLIQSEGHTIQALFRRYRDHVDRAHPIISSLAATDYAANAYLMALGRDFQTLHLCTGVVEYMLRSPHATPRSTPRGDVVEHAVPTVQTWSILLAAFLRHGQRMAARKVLDMMRKRRLEPNLVTWNTLISGLSRLQDVNGALSALRDMKDAGFEMDHRTLEGLGWIRDRRNLLQALKESDQEQDDEDFSDDDPDLDGGHHIESDGEQRPS
ncbi:hypothetical protein MMC16_000749 [Acarospora aff. strigata]|nr:hypothetical protein [Acarospora aff. strigata]